MLIYSCSSNRGKLKEFALAARSAALTLEPLPNLERITPPEEYGDAFEANASLKAIYYSAFTSEIVLADDSGLSVDALHGAPGINSARYAGPGADAAANNARLLQNVGGVSERSAHFVCLIALAKSGRVLQMARGTVDGQILCEPRGSNTLRIELAQGL